MIQNRPPLGATLDRSHPLSRGLVLALPLNEFGDSQFTNLADGRAWLPDSQANWSRDLLGIRGTGVSGQSFLTGSTRIRASAEFTLEILLLRISPGSGSSDLVACNTNQATITSSAGSDIFNGLASQSWASADGFTTLGGWQQIIQRGFNPVAGAATFDAWQNGRALTRKIPGVTIIDTTAPSRIGSTTTAFNLCPDVIGWLRLWERALSDAEIASLQGGRWPHLARAKTVVVLGDASAASNQTLVAPAFASSGSATPPALLALPRTMVAPVITANATATGAAVPVLGASPSILTPAVIVAAAGVVESTLARRLVPEAIATLASSANAVVVIGGGAARTIAADVASGEGIAIPPAVRVSRRLLVAPVVVGAGAALVPGRAAGAAAKPPGVARGTAGASSPAVLEGVTAIAVPVVSGGLAASPPAVVRRTVVAATARGLAGAVAIPPAVIRGGRTLVAGVAIAGGATLALPGGVGSRTTRAPGVAIGTSSAAAPAIAKAKAIAVGGVARAVGVAITAARSAPKTIAVGVAIANSSAAAAGRVVGRSVRWPGVAVAGQTVVAPSVASGPRMIPVTAIARATCCAGSPSRVLGGRTLSSPAIVVATSAATNPTTKTIPAGAARWWIDATDVGRRDP